MRVCSTYPNSAETVRIGPTGFRAFKSRQQLQLRISCVGTGRTSCPTPIREVYELWLANRQYRRNVEQIEIDELHEVCDVSMHDDSSESLSPIYEKHAQRRVAARFLVATQERYRLERLAKRWDVDAPRMIHRGEADEAAIAEVRRAVKEARWTFVERCSKVLMPVLSLLVALVALLTNPATKP